MKVKFNILGRHKKSWKSDITNITHTCLYDEVRENGGLMSREINLIMIMIPEKVKFLLEFGRLVPLKIWILKNLFNFFLCF